jgi:hypothetical protein
VAYGRSPKRLRADPQLALELEVCRDYKIAHSAFLAWDQDDRDKAIWAHIQDRQTCQQCGTRPDEWDPEQGGHRHAYLARVEVCRGCQAKHQRDKALTDEQRQPGVQVVLKRRGSDHAEP